MYVSIGLHRSVTYIIDSLRVHSEDCDRSSMLVINFEKKKLDCARVCSFPVGVLTCVRHKQSGYLAFRTTKVKGTKLTLAVILF